MNLRHPVPVSNLAAAITWSMTRVCYVTRLCVMTHVCDVTQSYVGHGSFTCVWRDVFICDDSCVLRDSSICGTWLIHMCVTWRIHMWWLMCVTWLNYMWDLTHSHVCNVTYSYVRTHVCDVNQWRVWHDSFTCVSSLINACGMPHSRVWHVCVTCMCDLTQSYVWHDSFTLVTWHSPQVQQIPRGGTFSKALSKLKFQSSNVSFHWNVAKKTFELELWALKQHSKMSLQVGSAVPHCHVTSVNESCHTWMSHVTMCDMTHSHWWHDSFHMYHTVMSHNAHELCHT